MGEVAHDMLPEGWLSHEAGDCPVPLETIVRVMHRTGAIRNPRPARWWTAFDPKFAEHDLWKHDGDQGQHIIAYKPISSEGDAFVLQNEPGTS